MMKLSCFLMFLVCLAAPMYALDCGKPTVALDSSHWQQAKPAHLPIEVMFANPSGWVGLNHVVMQEEKTEHRVRTLIPTLAPSFVQIFPFPHALEELDNPRPVFYVHAQDGLAATGLFRPKEAHLVRLKTVGSRRELMVTSGIDGFTIRRQPPSSVLVPIAITRLSGEIFRIQPTQPLQEGEYLILFGYSGGDGFEFGVECSRK
ncbi:MAG TPA: hypothetical protein VHX63_17775 [Acidobacteriaceae bacterium]|nr:hypothetical protein [Acidobacteriaceae bacterium]